MLALSIQSVPADVFWMGGEVCIGKDVVNIPDYIY